MSLPDHIPLKHRRTTLERAEKFISKKYFSDVNLQSKVYPEKLQVQKINHYKAPGRISYDDAIKGMYTPTHVGQSFGPVWSTHWFELFVDIPESWAGQEVHLLWNSGSEALVWVNGEARQGLNAVNEKNYYILSDRLDKMDRQFKVYIEMACNTLFGIGSMTRCNKEDESKTFTLSQAAIALFDHEAFSLVQDIESLHGISQELGEDQRGYQALYTANNILNLLATRDKSVWVKCKEMADKFFSQKNGESQHTLYAMGHGHIDSAWLWPYEETKRKCARSWACSIRLMEKYPNFIFCCSQAQQYAWVKENYPSLWKDVCKFVARGQFVPVGGAWVEMDGNMPSGEACIRQFIYGQKFFWDEFKVRCKEFWLPDTFGYSGQFPQILRHCGITRFLSQKLSWSIVNKFPHHTFQWEGIDGSTVLAHFPPGESYEMSGTAKELRKSVCNFSDKGRSNRSAFLFGHGDGGHGPSEEMLGRLHRFKDCDGLPKVQFSGSDEFFSSIEKEDTYDMLCRWRGELYLELHNGTYTTWARVKRGNRKMEIFLQDIETISTMACLLVKSFQYPYAELERLWKLLLRNQFHDVLPGSSISQVFTDAMGFYNDILKCGDELHTNAAIALVDSLQSCRSSETRIFNGVNPHGFEICKVLALSPAADKDEEKPAAKKRKTMIETGSNLVMVKIPPMSLRRLKDCVVNNEKPILFSQEGENFVLQNDLIRAVVDPRGRVLSLKCVDPNNKEATIGPEAINPSHPANQFVEYDDIPLFWDAWDVMDYHLETRKPLCDASQQVKVVLKSPLRVCLSFSIKISDESHIKQTITLDAGCPYLRFDTEVLWRENRKFLKVEFPTTVHAMEASYDIQSGFIRRPNHFNTSWDSARFEVCGHKWADISQHGFGVSILNDCKYGYSTVDGVIRLSLLRSPKGPDPTADMDQHEFSYAMMPHMGNFQEAGVIQQAIAFNSVKIAIPSPHNFSLRTMPSLFRPRSLQVLIQTVKMAEDRSRAVILRLNEAHGGSVRAQIESSHIFSKVEVCNGLEEEEAGGNEELQLEILGQGNGSLICLSMKPFQIVTLKCIV